MNEDTQKSVRALEELLVDDMDLTTSELRADLEAQGVDVEAFLARFAKTVRTSVQQETKKAAQEASKEASQKKERMFGRLVDKPMSQLLEIFERVRAGEFGAECQQAALARCRNLKESIPTETELRSWLEDISTTKEQ